MCPIWDNLYVKQCIAINTVALQHMTTTNCNWMSSSPVGWCFTADYLVQYVCIWRREDGLLCLPPRSICLIDILYYNWIESTHYSSYCTVLYCTLRTPGHAPADSRLLLSLTSCYGSERYQYVIAWPDKFGTNSMEALLIDSAWVLRMSGLARNGTGRTCLARSNFRVRSGTGKIHFPCSAWSDTLLEQFRIRRGWHRYIYLLLIGEWL